jgi:hypothetical protein
MATNATFSPRRTFFSTLPTTFSHKNKWVRKTPVRTGIDSHRKPALRQRNISNEPYLGLSLNSKPCHEIQYAIKTYGVHLNLILKRKTLLVIVKEIQKVYKPTIRKLLPE